MTSKEQQGQVELTLSKSVEYLLSQVDKISSKHETIAQATGSRFNIFETTNINENEVRMCRVLAELLDPSGTHCQGRTYLDLFFKIVLGIEVPLEQVSIVREEVIEGDRRIDIVVKYDGCVIPIEVKINAGDQPNQLYDYAKKSRGLEKHKVYYLTKFGSEPSSESSCNLKKDDIGCISWADHILKWLETCISLQSTITRPPIRETLLQYASAIRKFTEQLEEDEKMEIEKLLLETPENMRNAAKIKAAFEASEKSLWKKFCAALENEAKNKLGKTPDKFDEWNIVYKLDEIDEECAQAVCINSDSKEKIKKLLIKVDKNLKFSEILSQAEDTFSIFELADNDKFEAMVENCVNWVKEKISLAS